MKIFRTQLCAFQTLEIRHATFSKAWKRLAVTLMATFPLVAAPPAPTPQPIPNDTTPDADALFARLFANPKPALKITPQEGIGFDDPQHSFQDPSNVIKVGDTYYVWLSWRPLDVHVYNSVIHYATSKDGKKWTQQGLALGKGAPGRWDDFGVLTPYVAEANGKFYLFYTGADRNFFKGSGNAIGLAVADKPEGPWTRVSDQPVLAPPTNPKAWDSHINDDAHVIKRDGKYWLYYKGHPSGKHWTLTQQGVAIADKIEGPYVKYTGNPVIKSGHCCCVWPHADGVAAIADIPKELLWAKDGLHFVVVKKGGYPGAGPGPYDPDAHTDTKFGHGITWGVTQFGQPTLDSKDRSVVARFDMDLRARSDAEKEIK
ncbi:MAG: xylosidase [Verrucomicrobia bacterium]|nr:MAG: xylosidase [Verrucomicrobiota bacterium]